MEEYVRKMKMIDEEGGIVRQSHWYVCAPGYASWGKYTGRAT